MEFELNLSLKELKMRTSKIRLKRLKMLDTESKEFQKLNETQKQILAHLVCASKYIEIAYYRMENKHNLEFQQYLKKEIEKGNEQARLTSILYYAQKSMFSPDNDGNFIELVKNIKAPFACNFYPQDLTVTEFHKILNKMLDENKVDEVQKILTQHTIVERKNDELVGIEYVDYFKPEFSKAGKELSQASNLCPETKLGEFLNYQALALTQNDQNLDCIADTLWAKLDDKIEFTVVRESYNDPMTESLSNNQELQERLKQNDIKFYAKDTLGARVGLVNEKGTKFLHENKKIISIIAKNMPDLDKFTQAINENNDKQNSVDVDIIYLAGGVGACQCGVTEAENLPNDDKLSFITNGYRKNEYHRQIRKQRRTKVINKILCTEQLEYFNTEADHWGVICHENTHTLGPKNVKLGQYTAIIEENKADMGALAFTPELQKAGIFTEHQCKQILCSYLLPYFTKSKPHSLAQAHAVQRVMIMHKMLVGGAITFNQEEKVVFDFPKVSNIAKEMMKELIEIQLSNSSKKAEEYINKHFIWTDDMEKMAVILRKNSKVLNLALIENLKDYLLSYKAN